MACCRVGGAERSSACIGLLKEVAVIFITSTIVWPKVNNGIARRIARRDKKAFLSDQCKEIEEYNRMGKTRGLFKKTGDSKGNFMQKKAQ